MLRAARWKCRTQKSRKNRHLGTIAQLCSAISLELRHISTIGKNLLNSNTSRTRPPQYGELRPTIGSLVWGTPTNFNGFRVLAALITARYSSSGRQANFAALNRGRHLYSAGRPSRWALAHILVLSTGQCHGSHRARETTNLFIHNFAIC